MPSPESTIVPVALVKLSAKRVLSQHGEEAWLFATERAQAAADAHDFEEENIWRAIAAELDVSRPTPPIGFFGDMPIQGGPAH